MSRNQPLLRWLISALVLAGILVACAGTLRYPMGWLYLAAYWGLSLPYALIVEESLDAERRKPGPGAMDSVSRPAATFLFLATVAVAALDAGRFHWSGSISWTIQLTSLFVSMVGTAVQIGAMGSNPFFSTAIRIQTERGHRVINTGPYRFIRHPGYLAMMITMPATALALGSYLALIPAACYSALILGRTAKEDKFLTVQLAGYTEYRARVRYRLIPRLW
jgi:protein-S-isoprenylcysteine O-methyltransferase Ste14